MRIVIAILTLLSVATLIVGAALSFIHALIGLGITCLLLAAMFGVFVWNDYEYFFGKK